MMGGSGECIYNILIEGDEASVVPDNLSDSVPIADQALLAIVALFLFVLESLTVAVVDFVLQPLRKQ